MAIVHSLDNNAGGRLAIDASAGTISRLVGLCNGVAYPVSARQTDSVTGQYTGFSDTFTPGARTGVSAFTGFIATNGRMCDTFTSGVTQMMSRTPHIARVAVTSVQLVIPNWYWTSAKGETSPGGAATVTCSVEKSNGTITTGKFSGATSASIADGGQVVSDAISISLAAGETFYVRIWYSNSAGILYICFPSGSSSSTDINRGGALTYGSSIADQTASGTVVDTNGTNGYANNPGYGPLAVLGSTTAPSVLLLGDSRCRGYGDLFNASGDVGEIARSIGTNYGYSNLGSYGDIVHNMIAANTKRLSLLPYANFVHCEAGINDIGNSFSFAQIQADLLTLYNQVAAPGRTVTASTLPPCTTYTTAQETVRQQINNWIRTNPGPLGTYFDVADAIETARNSGTPKSGYYTDNIHQNQTGYLAIVSASSIPMQPFT